MRTTLDLPASLVNEALKVAHQKTKTAVIIAALEDFLRKNKLQGLKKFRGKVDLEIDLDGHTVRRSGELVELTPTEFNLLVALVSQPGRAFTRLQLLDNSQGAAYEGYERTIDAHIKNLRAKLEPDPKNPRYIETVFGVGYRFIRPA